MTASAAPRAPKITVRATLIALGPDCTHSALVNHLREERLDVPLELYDRLRRELWPGLSRKRGASRPGPAWRCQRQALLEAARSLPQPFGYGQLVVRCWELRPDLFGLEGQPAHPCSHRVSGALYGRCGPLAAGVLARVEGGFVVREKIGEGP